MRERHEVSSFMEVIRVVFLPPLPPPPPSSSSSIHAPWPSFPKVKLDTGEFCCRFTARGAPGDKQDGAEKKKTKKTKPQPCCEDRIQFLHEKEDIAVS